MGCMSHQERFKQKGKEDMAQLLVILEDHEKVAASCNNREQFKAKFLNFDILHWID